MIAEPFDTIRPLVLVVEDERHIADLLVAAIRFEDLEAVARHTGPDGLAAAIELKPDAVVLDVMLPGLDGFEIARRLRRAGISAPILFLTARESADDAVAGLGAGGDDYIRKPFSLAEVVARIRAQIRRAAGSPATVLRFSDIELDDEAHEVRRAGRLIELTATEFNLLRLFLENPRRVLSRARILDRVWRYDFEGNGNVVDLYVGYLRRKLGADGPVPIRTVRGVGYVLRDG
ncbi:MAG: response regulator transcription factor [Candidatus Limnocylindrales bacterium]